MIGATTISGLAMGVLAAIFPAVVGIITAWIAFGRNRVVPPAATRRAVLAPSSRLSPTPTYR
jgi:hypothetical protein